MPDTEIVVLLCLAALLAGWIDAVAGGGGLIQLPALLVLLPGATPAQVLATNKLDDGFDASRCPERVTEIRFARRNRDLGSERRDDRLAFSRIVEQRAGPVRIHVID